MSRRKKPQEESFETAEGFQIEDMEGNAVTDDIPLIDKLDAEEDERNAFWDDEDDEKEEDEYFNSVAENNDWEEGYDY
jgi:hypothetical protein